MLPVRDSRAQPHSQRLYGPRVFTIPHHSLGEGLQPLQISESSIQGASWVRDLGNPFSRGSGDLGHTSKLTWLEVGPQASPPAWPSETCTAGYPASIQKQQLPP